MKLSYIISLLLLFLISCKSEVSGPQDKDKSPDYAIVLHGGAGTILKKNMTGEKELAYRTTLGQALDIGEAILKNGGASLDAVESTIRFLEDSPLFNAGKGAVFTADGRNEMDASIMDGKDQNAGSVGSVTTVKNPISAARAVMERSAHVFLVREGAEQFAAENGLEIVKPEYFYTKVRYESLQKIKEREKLKNESDSSLENKHGTVGVVALDKEGNIAAGTSTGGMTNKRYNRIGDSPVIGAGTYADNSTCGVSATGHGEYFIRYAVAHDIHAQMLYGHKSLKDAARHIIYDVLVQKGGTGGVIALDSKGNITMPFNTEGMYRAYATPDYRFIGIYKEDGNGKISD